MKKTSLHILIAIFAMIFMTATGAYAVDADGDGIDDAVDANPGYALRVNTMPNGLATPVGNGDSQPYAYPGLSLDVWGSATYGTAPFTYVWNFGDGSPNATGTATTATAARNISAMHTYAAGSYLASLTVTDANGKVESSTLKLDVVPVSDEVKVNLAIQKAMKYLYMNRTVTGSNAYFYSYEYTPFAILAFEDHGHRAKNDVTKDIYAPLVQQGLNYMFSIMTNSGALGNDPVSGLPCDSNGNNKGVYYYSANLYHQGAAMMALANTSDPTAIVSGGSQNGRSYSDVLRDMVDWTVYAQHDSGVAKGGWRYGANGGADNSVNQWPVLGLIAAEQPPFSIAAPAWVKTKLVNWINYSQSASGGFGYTQSNYYDNVAKTGSGIISITYAGGGGNIANALSFLNTYWNADGGGWLYHYNIRYHYAMYAVKKGLQYAGISMVGAHDWQKEYNTWYVNNQNSSGYWATGYWIGAGIPSASFGLLVMAPGLVELPPVANAGIDQVVNPGMNVTFDGSASFHSDPTKHIVGYKWDFDASNGVNWAAPDSTAQVVTKLGGYADLGHDYDVTATLQVTDEDGHTSTDIANVHVQTGNVPPVSDAGGPYLVAIGEDITLDGSGSYDPNAAPDPLNDHIVTYAWDLDGDNDFNDAFGISPVVNFGLSFVGTKTVALRVTDSYGATAAASTTSTTVAVSNLQASSYGCLTQTLNRLTGVTTVTRCMTLANVGDGAASAITATMSSVPFGVTVIDGNLSWTGSIAPNGGTLQSADTFRYSYRRGTGVDLTRITWDIEFTDALGTRHVVRNVPQ
ncbi:MAG: PKD domain-containing protein [Nitrospirae bacterium]|nr:PKD domain-containing protein [Nitrospirota bacterium]